MPPFAHGEKDWRCICAHTAPEGVANEAAWNMAVDESLLESVMTNMALPTLRLYQWRLPAITLGHFQNERHRVDLDEAHKDGVSVARRRTGGRGILHGDDLTVGIMASMEALNLRGGTGIAEIYARLAAGFVDAFARLGIAAVLGPRRQTRGRSRAGDCFALASEADVIETATGAKLLGAALYRHAPYILLQASIPVYRKRERFVRLREKYFGGELPLVPAIAEAGLDMGELETALIGALGQVLNADFSVFPMTSRETCRALDLTYSGYGSLVGGKPDAVPGEYGGV